MTGRCAQTHRHTHTSNEHIISAIHFVHLAEIITPMYALEMRNKHNVFTTISKSCMA